jgi:hypothetical protein
VCLSKRAVVDDNGGRRVIIDVQSGFNCEVRLGYVPSAREPDMHPWTSGATRYHNAQVDFPRPLMRHLVLTASILPNLQI